MTIFRNICKHKSFERNELKMKRKLTVPTYTFVFVYGKEDFYSTIPVGFCSFFF